MESDNRFLLRQEEDASDVAMSIEWENPGFAVVEDGIKKKSKKKVFPTKVG